MSTSFDPNEIEAGNYGQPYDEADEFEIADVSVGIDKTADQIEQERSFDEVPPGEWELKVIGFLNPPKRESKTVYVNGHRASYDAYSVIVKFCRSDAPGQQVTDYFLLPPDDPKQQAAYFTGASSPEGKGAGFMASKFYHFMDRLGYQYPKGGALPAEARKLGNWKGRGIVAKVEPGKPYMDQTTGIEKPGRNQIKPFSYKPAGTPAAGPSGATGSGGGAGGGYPAPPRRPGGPSGAAQMAASGLDNI